LVTLATGRTILGLSGRGPEVTLLPLREAEWGTIGPDAAEDIFKYLEQNEGYRALLIGPGLGKEEPTSKFLQRLLGLEETRQKSRVGFRVHPETDEPVKESQQPERTLPPLVLDADSLNILAEMENWPTYLPREQCILTPHPGEMRRLLGVDSLGGDLVQVATDAAKQWKQVVVLKGSTTVIAAPGGRSLVHAAANPALATAGTGDVLAGCIAGLLAQGMQLFDAATLGVYLHSTAGAKMQEELGDAGTLASDLLAHLPRVLKELSGR
jgi:NAD(P)H-hydrate epimerase